MTSEQMGALSTPTDASWEEEIAQARSGEEAIPRSIVAKLMRHHHASTSRWPVLDTYEGNLMLSHSLDRREWEMARAIQNEQQREPDYPEEGPDSHPA